MRYCYNTIEVTEETISQIGLENSAAKLIPDGALLMAMYGQGVTRGKWQFLALKQYLIKPAPLLP